MNKLRNLRKNIHSNEVIALARQHRQQIIEWLEDVEETEWTKAFQHRGACSDIEGIFLGFCLGMIRTIRNKSSRFDKNDCTDLYAIGVMRDWESLCAYGRGL